jgi:hypothetical protein
MPDKNTTDPAATASAATGATSPAPPDAPKYEERRSEHRIRVRWHVDALVDGQMQHGIVKDISPKGADILLEHNLQNAKLIRLHIHVPPLSVTDDHHAVEISGKIIYSSHDSDEMLFRTGVKFLQFHLESDQTYLQSRLGKH